jgi:hypothetical protein
MLDKLPQSTLTWRKALFKIANCNSPKDTTSAYYNKLFDEGFSKALIDEILTELSYCKILRGWFARMIRMAPLTIEEQAKSYTETFVKEVEACCAKQLEDPNWLAGINGLRNERLHHSYPETWNIGADYLKFVYEKLKERMMNGVHSPKLSPASVSKHTREVISPELPVDQMLTGIDLENHRLNEGYRLPLPDCAPDTHMEMRPKFYPSQLDNRNYYVCGYREQLDASIVGRILNKVMNDFSQNDPKTRLDTTQWTFTEEEFLTIWDLTAFTSRLGTLRTLLQALHIKFQEDDFLMDIYDLSGIYQVKASDMWLAFTKTQDYKTIDCSGRFAFNLIRQFKSQQGGLLGVQGNLSISTIAHTAITLSAIQHSFAVIVGDDGRFKSRSAEEDDRLTYLLNRHIGNLALEKASLRSQRDKVCLKRGLQRLEVSNGIFRYNPVGVLAFPHFEEPLQLSDFETRYMWLAARSDERQRSKKMSSSLISFYDELSRIWSIMPEGGKSQRVAEIYSNLCYRRYKLPKGGWVPQILGGYFGLTPIQDKIGFNPYLELSYSRAELFVDMPLFAKDHIIRPISTDDLKVGSTFECRSSQALSYLTMMGRVTVTPVYRKVLRFQDGPFNRHDRLLNRFFGKPPKKHDLLSRVKVIGSLHTDVLELINRVD